jgi:peptide/nickel transport system substrate-binding protein
MLGRKWLIAIALVVIVLVAASAYYVSSILLNVSPSKTIVYSIADRATPSTADPALVSALMETGVAQNMYDPLIFADQDNLGKPKAWVATSWEVSTSGLNWTFHLRQGIKFHNGMELTARDVVFSLDRMMAIGKGQTSMWKGFIFPGDTIAVDNYTVQINLKKSFSCLPSTFVQFLIVSKEGTMAHKQAGDYGEFGDYGVAWLRENDEGSGPYKLKTWLGHLNYVLTKFEGYWAGFKPGSPDEVRMYVAVDEPSQKMALVKGDLDQIDKCSGLTTWEELQKEAGIVVQVDPTAIHYYAAMNCMKPPLDDVHVRRAISYAFDYQTAVSSVMTKGSTLAKGPIGSIEFGYNNNTPYYTRDLDKARVELALSKYSSAELEALKDLEYAYPATNPRQENIGLLLQTNLKDIGFNVIMKPMLLTAWVSTMVDNQTTAHFNDFESSTRYPSADYHAFIYYSKQWGSWPGSHWWKNETVDALLERSRASSNETEIYAIYDEVARTVVDQAVSLFIGDEAHYCAYRDYIKGYKCTGTYGYEFDWRMISVQKAS